MAGKALSLTNTHVYVVPRTVNLSDDAYARLASLKLEGESFSDVVTRLTGKYAIRQLYGILTPAQGKALARAVKDSRRRLDADFAKRRVRL